MISLYIPVFNNESWCRSVDLPSGFRSIASDNCSEDNSGDLLEEKGVEVFRQKVNLGRIENWEWCVNHFISSSANWMKWLFAGDILLPGAAAFIEDSFHLYPSVGMVVSEYLIVSESTTSRWRMFDNDRVVEPPESMKLIAERGNWFGSPVGHAFHRDTVATGFDFGCFPWVADMFFCMGIAEKVPVLYRAKVIGEFHVQQRRYFRQRAKKTSSLLEEGVVRYLAADKYLELTGDKSIYNDLIDGIELDIRKKIIKSSGIVKTINCLINR